MIIKSGKILCKQKIAGREAGGKEQAGNPPLSCSFQKLLEQYRHCVAEGSTEMEEPCLSQSQKVYFAIFSTGTYK